MSETPIIEKVSADSQLLSFSIDLSLGTEAVVAVAIVMAVLAVVWLWRSGGFKFRSRKFSIEGVEFGIGNQKIVLKPNDMDLQIAYKIWVELSTRKIGLQIDPENDVIAEIYDSWYQFFSVTRELLKDVPVKNFKRRETQKIIRLSIDILNKGIRPHLTKWQARFRAWYEMHKQGLPAGAYEPQIFQKQFPEYEQLMEDMLKVNQNLIHYREKMYELISSN